MISKKQYLRAKKIVADYEQQLKQSRVVGRFKISFSDVVKSWGGFSVPKITSMSDDQLNELSFRLDEIATCNYTNIEEYRYLTVGWVTKKTMTDEDVNRVVEILNCLLQEDETK